MIIVLVVLLLVLLVFKTNNKEVTKEVPIYKDEDGFKIHSYITNDMINNSEKYVMYPELISEFTPDIMFNESDAIALVTITTIDGASMEYSLYGMTYGTMIIDNVIYGDLKSSNELISYLKPGGFVTIADYDAHDNPDSVEKRDRIREEAGVVIDKNNTYIKMQIEGDVEIEAGKTYLAYLHYIEKYAKYEIIGLRNGLREVNIPKQTRVKTQCLDLNRIEIKNNVTGEWEDLDQYIQENIEVYK